jgi:hypothetical protein
MYPNRIATKEVPVMTMEELVQSTACFECGAQLPTVRRYCGRPSEKGWPVDEDGTCGARMCSDDCSAAHGEKHVAKALEAAERREAKRRRAERLGWR